MINLEIKYNEKRDRATQDTIGYGINAYNASRVGSHDFLLLNIEAHNSQGEVVGGLIGDIFFDWLHIDILWLKEDYRKSGLGSRIMQAAEQEAKNKACVGIYLDTFSFQARGFYEKLGYAIFGELNNFPGEHQRYFLKKRID